MNAAKIQLSSGHNEAHEAGGAPIYHNIKNGWEISAEERALVADADLIFTKNAIIAKVLVLFGELSGTLQEEWKKGCWLEDQRMEEVLEIPPRISKGENYKGLPWVVLDYPRSFGRLDVFAVRTLFWWGNYFSVTLHLKGIYKEMFLAVVRDQIPLLAAAGFFIGVSGDEWRHELGQENYRALQGMGPDEADGLAGQQDFLKFSAKCDLTDWNEASRLLLQLCGVVMKALSR